ncbi:unnamed protein product, partial [Effrenium voratum]
GHLWQALDPSASLREPAAAGPDLCAAETLARTLPRHPGGPAFGFDFSPTAGTDPKARHPGGVGTIVQVLQVLAECTQERAPLAERPPKGRPPLGEKMLQEAPEVLDKEKAAEENFLKKLVSSSSLWPQVLAALPPPPARVTVTRAYNSSSNFDI